MNKLLIYVVTYNHEKFIKDTLERIDKKIFDIYDTEILVKYLEFIEDVNNKVSTLSKEERAKHISISKGILFARGC